MDFYLDQVFIGNFVQEDSESHFNATDGGITFTFLDVDVEAHTEGTFIIIITQKEQVSFIQVIIFQEMPEFANKLINYGIYTIFPLIFLLVFFNFGKKFRKEVLNFQGRRALHPLMNF